MADQLNQDLEKIVQELVRETVAKVTPLLAARRRSTGYNCTGQEFQCSTFYICDNNNHSCRTDVSFGCGGSFDCTGGAFGIVVERI